MTLSHLAQQPIAAHEGMTLVGVTQALGGIVALLLIAYLCSSNRKAINWKTVGFGLMLQFMLALSILKLSWVQTIFNAIGKIFVSILDFTAAGSVFLFGDLMNADTYGFIFVFQILPTIVFFPSLNSLLFYHGLLQF